MPRVLTIGHRSVYNWQFLNCLRVWTRLLTQYGSKAGKLALALSPALQFMTVHFADDALNPLVYPLVQVVLGVIDLLPAARYFPLRFFCARLLNDVSNQC